MIERDGPKQGPDIAIEPTILNFRDPNLRFETGVRITGMETWKEVAEVFTKLMNNIVKDFQPDKSIPIHIIKSPNLETCIKRKDGACGFHGLSTGFEVEIIPTDLSLIKPGQRKTEPDPELARTFVLSRRLRSSSLLGPEAIVSTACTVSLVNKGVFFYRNSYGDGLNSRQNFGVSINTEAVNEAALKTIKRSMKTPMSATIGKQSHTNNKGNILE